MPRLATTSLKTRLLQGAVVALVGLTLAGCTATKDKITTGSIPASAKPVETMDVNEMRSATERAGQIYEKNPRDHRAAPFWQSRRHRRNRGTCRPEKHLRHR